MKLRERFTLAHELAHTVFYQLNGGVPKPIKGLPKGQKLERLCHIGASQILIPDSVLKHVVRTKGEVASAETILDLARFFSVSVEVLMRRLHKLGLIANEKFAAILVDTVEGRRRVIQAACYGPPLSCNATPPKRGLDYDSWVPQLMAPPASPEDSEWIHKTPSATIVAKKVFRSNRSFILELKFAAPNY
ncbi:MAG: ImmA/IrrE family metallo-endopeptidase [Candidatus Acidiferrales bacterium]